MAFTAEEMMPADLTGREEEPGDRTRVYQKTAKPKKGKGAAEEDWGGDAEPEEITFTEEEETQLLGEIREKLGLSEEEFAAFLDPWEAEEFMKGLGDRAPAVEKARRRLPVRHQALLGKKWSE